MSDEDSVLWIKTRDGSPTLWSNELSEPFRSTKGAFSESWAAFVGPALEYAKVENLTEINAGEFGLGPGTNWLLLSIAAQFLDMPLRYTVIEKDLSFFEAGKQKWVEIFPSVIDFVSTNLGFNKDIGFDSLAGPVVYESVDLAVDKLPEEDKVHVWFHDPFGFSVNPEGYSAETLQKCSRLWQVSMGGFSYASNRNFKNALESIEGVRVKVLDTGSDGLKRNRLEFYRNL